MIIAFTGDHPGVGKTTAVNMLLDILAETEIIKFADPLYQMQEAIYTIAGLPLPKKKDRKLLQWLGTDWGRSISKNIWLDTFKSKVGVMNPYIVLNDDVRFNNEAILVKELGGIIIKLSGNGTDRSGCEGIKGHISENGIDVKHVDYFINNMGTKKELKEKLLILMRRISASGRI